MNPKTPSPYTSQPYTNGHYKTPLESSGVSLPPSPSTHVPTVFGEDLPLRGWGPLFYGLSRFQQLTVPVVRSFITFLLLIALLAGFAILPGYWLTVILSLALCGGIIAVNLYFRRKQYVSFTPAPPPAPNDAPLPTNEKLPIFATGLLNVEGRYRRFSLLPGFYRTFATGEHALLCLVKERNWLALLTWPADETGMWYAFVNPSEIQHLTWGTVAFGPTIMPAIAIEYLLQLPPGPRRKRPEIHAETLYVATPKVADMKRIYVDLHRNLSLDQIPAPLSAQR